MAMVENKEITCSELQAYLMREEKCWLLDVRTPQEVERVAFPGAYNIPLSALESRVAELPQDEYIIAICHHGHRSLQAVYLLNNLGLVKVQSLRGGIDAWSIHIDSSLPRY